FSRETRSHLPDDTDLLRKQATQLETVEAVFIPDAHRLVTMSNSRLTKLAFLMDAILNVHDFTYSLLARVDDDMAVRYLAERGYVSQFDAEPDTFELTAEYSPPPWPASFIPE